MELELVNKDLLHLLKQCEIFNSLYEDADLESLQIERVEIPAGKILFNQNDPSDYLYILVNGRLSTYLTTANVKIKIVGIIEPVETIGELGILSGETRSLTAQAITKCELLRIPGESFKLFCQKYPSILLDTMKPIITRSQKTIKVIAGEDAFKWAVVMPANQDAPMTKFRDKMREADLTAIGIKLLHSSEIKTSDTKTFFENLGKQYRRIIMLVDSLEQPNAKICMEKANTMYILANGDKECYMDAQILDMLNKTYPHTRHELILLHSDRILMPNNTTEWLRKAHFSLHHHIRIGNDSDYRRLLRFFSGKTVGLVLSGGGAKGWLHLGVIKALIDMDIEIDAVGGTSVGAMAGLCFAMYQSYPEILEQFRDVAQVAYKITSLSNLTLPVISLFNAHRITRALQKSLSNIRLENLWLPYFCISANLSLQKEEVHHSGYAWEMIRCSGSLPGIVPPVVINGQMQVDGGLVNNLPVDVMKNLLGSYGKVIATKLSNNHTEPTHYNFPSSLSLADAILVKLGIKKYNFPPLFDTFFDSLLLGASLKEKQNSSSADILINPNLSSFSMYSLDKKQEQQLIELGYQRTCEEIKSFLMLEEKAKKEGI